MKELFSRPGIAGETGEIISLRNSLANHPDGHEMGLREAYNRLLKPNDGDGFARGCRLPGSVKIDYLAGERELGGVLPEWVPVAGNARLVRDHRTGSTHLVPDYTGETRTVEGILTGSKIAHHDFQFKPWHTYYDWNFIVDVDKQYTYLLGRANLHKNLESGRDNFGKGQFECEWDTAFLPSWAWPQVGDRVWLVGRWICDCGHPDENYKHRTEIHPPKAVACFRSEAMNFTGNKGPTRANNAVLYIAQRGGYWDQPINNQDYVFDLYLPPKPYAEAVPKWNVASKTGSLPVQPRITPYPADNPRALRVVIPLKNVSPHPEEYGAIISAGWSDPRDTESKKIKRLRVTVEKIFMDANLDPHGKDEWYVYVGINGRWNVWKSLNGDSTTLNYSVDLDLHPDDKVHITACGFEADEIHDLMGKSIGLTWAEIVDHSQAKNNAEKIRSGFLSLGLSLDPNIDNEPISTFSKIHSPGALSSVTAATKDKDYRLRYRIEER
jgi:hypothetical protein